MRYFASVALVGVVAAAGVAYGAAPPAAPPPSAAPSVATQPPPPPITEHLSVTGYGYVVPDAPKISTASWPVFCLNKAAISFAGSVKLAATAT